MNDKNLPASKELINSVLHPHVELAADVVGMVISRNRGDSTYRYQIAALTILLAGVDKALSLACLLMYLGRKVEWKWLTKHYAVGALISVVSLVIGFLALIGLRGHPV